MIRNTKVIPSLWKRCYLVHQRHPNQLLPMVKRSTVQHSSLPDGQSTDSRITNNTQHFQISDIKKETFCSPVEASNHTKCLSAQAPNEEAAAECGNGRTGWWVVVVVGLIWGQSIDLPSLYLLPAHHAKINGKANSSPPQCGLVNTQLISQSLKLTSQLLTY